MNQEKIQKLQAVPFLDLLKIPRPVKASDLDASQINLLYEMLKEYTIQKLKNPADVDQLFTALSSQDKYEALRLQSFDGNVPLNIDEKSWIMYESNPPNPFISFLRSKPQVMEILRMSFRPRMVHQGMMEAADLFEILRRFEFWMQNDKDRSMKMLGYIDQSDQYFANSKTPQDTLIENWVYRRYFASVLNEGVHWVAVLIDRNNHSFEYYDPMGRDLDWGNTSNILVQRVLNLYNTAKKLDPEIRSEKMSVVRRGFHKHQRGGTECGMYVLLFLFSRIVQEVSFEEFMNLHIDDVNCKQLKYLFFDFAPDRFTPQTESSSRQESSYSDTTDIDRKSQKFAIYDYRIAMLNMNRFIDHIEKVYGFIGTNFTHLKTSIFEQIKRLSSVDTLQKQGIEAQTALLSVLPEEIKKYLPSALWLTLVQETVHDSLTVQLRGISKSTIRKQTALNIFENLFGWVYKIDTDPEYSEQMQTQMNYLIESVYLPILHFLQENIARFNKNLSSQVFLKETMSRKDTVSFGVSFLRELNAFMKYNMNMGLHNNILDMNYPQKSSIFNLAPVNLPPSPSIPRLEQLPHQAAFSKYERRTIASRSNPTRSNYNRSNYSTIFNKCDMYVEKAKQILRDSLVNQYTSRQSAKSLLVSVGHFVNSNANDYENHKLFEPLQPWHFPVNVDQFGEFSQQLDHADRFYRNKDFDLSTNDFVRLWENDEYRAYYMTNVYVLMQQLKSKRSVDRDTIVVAALSLVQFYAAMKSFGDNKLLFENLLCNVISDLLQVVGKYKSEISHQPTLNQMWRIRDGCDRELKRGLRELNRKFVDNIKNRASRYFKHK